MNPAFGQEGILEQGQEHLGHRHFVDTVGGKQPELVAKAETDAIRPAVREADVDGPAEVGDTGIVGWAEAVGGQRNHQGRLGADGDGAGSRRGPAGEFVGCRRKRLGRREAEDPETEGCGAGWHGPSMEAESSADKIDTPLPSLIVAPIRPV